MTAGDEAEDLVALWAGQCGFTVNKPIRDRAGWDQIFDLTTPRARSASDPLGLPTEVLSGRFQIKEVRTKKLRRSVPVKLSNLRFAIEDPLPWFFIVVCFNGKSKTPTEVAIIHVDRTVVEDVLRKLYSLDEMGRKKLHKIKHSVTWGRQHVLRKPYDAALKKIVADAVPRSLHDYASAKRAWHETVGYGAPRVGNVRFTISGATKDEVMERMARAVVGLEDSLEIDQFEAQHERFGAMHPDKRFDASSSQEGKLSVGSSSANQGFFLHLIDANGSRRVSLSATFQSSAVALPDFPEEHWISRLQARFLDIVVRHKPSQVVFKFLIPSEKEPFRLRDLLGALELLYACDRRNPEALKMQLCKGDATVFEFGFERSLTINQPILWLREHAAAIHALAKSLDADQDLQLSLIEVAMIYPKARLMLCARQRNGTGVVSLECDVPDALVRQGDQVTIVSDPNVVLAGTAFMEIVALKGIADILSTSAGKHTIRVVTSDISSLRSHRCAPNDLVKFPFEEAVAALQSDLRVSGSTAAIIARLENRTQLQLKMAET